VAKKHPEIKRLTHRCSKAMAQIIVSSQGNNVLFLQKIQQKMDHYCNDHTHCESPEKCNKVDVILNSKSQKTFKVPKFTLKNIQNVRTPG
jgi:hypothetical protein